MKKAAGIGMLLFCILGLAPVGCTRFNLGETPTPVVQLTAPPPAATQPPAAAATLAPTVTLGPLETNTPPAPTATHVPAGNVHASTNVISLNLRSGPGTAFLVRYKAEKGAQFLVQGRAPGDNWALVKKANGQVGWVTLDFLVLQGALEDVPVVAVDFARVISGRVIDPSGTPVDGIIMAVSKGKSLTTNPRTEATTDASGQFYAYLPRDINGTLYVGEVGIACKSHVATANCSMPGSVTPQPFTLLLAGSDPAPITFRYIPQ